MTNKLRIKETISFLLKKLQDVDNPDLLTDPAVFKVWQTETRQQIEKYFGKDSKELKDFHWALVSIPQQKENWVSTKKRDQGKQYPLQHIPLDKLKDVLAGIINNLEPVLSKEVEFNQETKPKILIVHSTASPLITIINDFLCSLSLNPVSSESLPSEFSAPESNLLIRSENFKFAIVAITAHDGRPFQEKLRLRHNVSLELKHPINSFNNKILFIVEKDVVVPPLIVGGNCLIYDETRQGQLFVKIASALTRNEIIRPVL